MLDPSPTDADATALLLAGATVVDPASGRVTTGASVLVDGGRVVSVSEDPQAAPAARRVDCTGWYVVPGLVDAHVHLRSAPHVGPSQDQPVPTAVVPDDDLTAYVRRLHSYLYCGVTSLYDAGNDPDVVLGLRQRERSGAITSPRVFCTGNLLTAPGGHGCQMGVEVADAAQLGPLLDGYLQTGPDLVKVTYDEHNWGVRPLVPVLSPALLGDIVDAVHAAGLRVAVHVSNELRAREAVECGVDVLAHPVIQSPVTEEFVAELAERQIPVVSTLAIGDRYFRLADRPEYLDTALYRDCESAEERHRLATEESAAQRANRWADWMRVMTPVAQENVRMLADAGGVVAAGTDLSFGPEMHRELELLAAAGIAPAEVLRCATHNGARVLGRAGELGTVTAGAAADLLVVGSDPTEDVRNLRDIRCVVKAGELVDRTALDLPVNRDEEATCAMSTSP